MRITSKDIPKAMRLIKQNLTKPKPEVGDTITVWFSCGAASAVAAKLVVDNYPQCNVVIVNNPIKEEHKDNLRFLKDVQEWLGVEIKLASHPNYPDNSCETLWADQKFMSSVYGAPCTQILKREAREIFEKDNPTDWIVLGFTVDEILRHCNFAFGERSNVLPVLIDRHLTKDDCFAIIQDAGITLPQSYIDGMPNANCIGCVKASGIEYWQLIRRIYPDVFKRRADQSRKLGAKLVRYNNERIFLDELPEDARGKPLKGLNFECSLFCGLEDV